MKSLTAFRQHIVEAPGIFDPEGVHHEFVSGMHGSKLDLDSIPTKSDLFNEWADTVAQKIDELYADRSGVKVLLSVANGTNRLVGPVAARLKDKWIPLETEKVSPKKVKLNAKAARTFQNKKPDFVLALEDVVTQGTTSASAVVAAREAGATEVEVLNTWQRQDRLIKLDEINATHHSIIHENLPTLEPDACRKTGYCAKGWKLIEHAK